MERKTQILISFPVLLVFCILVIACDERPIVGIWGLKKIVFHSNGGSPVPDQNVLRDQTIRRPKDPTRVNFKFEAWYEDNDSFLLPWDFNTVPETDLDLYAKWRDYGLTLIPHADVAGSVPVGYSNIEVTIIAKNTTDEIMQGVQIYLSGANGVNFHLTPDHSFDLAPQQEMPFTVSPFEGLPIGSYSATVTVSNKNYSNSFNIFLEVTAIPILSASLIVTEPVTDTAPDLSVLIADNALNDGSYYVSAVAWNPSHITFQPETSYTVSVTLTAGTGYSFTQDTSAFVNGNPAPIASSSGSQTAVVSYQFDATLPRVITELSINSDPTKMTYTHGDALDLTGLSLKVKYDTGVEDVLEFGSFPSSISIEPAHDTILQRGDAVAKTPIHDGAVITVTDSASGLSDVTTKLTVNMAAGAVVEKPVLNIAASNTSVITVYPVTASSGQDVEYTVGAPSIPPLAIGYSNTTSIHGSYSTGVEYFVYARSSENYNYYEGTPSVSDVINFYTVSFNANGGSTVQDQVIIGGGTAVAPSDPTKTDQNFAGWYDNSALSGDPFNFATPVTQDITLYAKWTDKPGFGVIEITVEQITDPLAGITIPVPSIVLSRAANETQQISINLSDYDTNSVKWEISGYPASAVTNADVFTIDSANPVYNALGGNSLNLTVSVGGIVYNRNIQFWIVE